MAGKKRKASANGGANASKRRANDGIVVVNPMLLQSMSSTQPSPAKTTKKPPQKTTKAAKKKPVNKQTEPVEKQSVGGCMVLNVEREDQVLAAAYWILLSRPSTTSNCVVALPNHYAATTPQQLGLILKTLGFTAVAIHNKMPPAQRKQLAERFLQNDATMVVVVNQHFLPLVFGATVDVILIGLERKLAFADKFATMYQVRLTKSVAIAAVDSEQYPQELTKANLQLLQSRWKIAMQIAELVQRISLANGKQQGDDADAKWAQKVAKGADLDDDNEDSDKKTKKKKALTPDEQRLQAWTDKLAVLLARRVGVEASSNQHQKPASSSHENQHAKEKLAILGIVTMNAAIGSSVHDERMSAQTQWLDQASGRDFGGDWDGAVRHGASKDKSSLQLRSHYCQAMHQNDKKDKNALAQWKPNENPNDKEKWGGPYGKVCGHNEVVMQFLRPFFPQVVLNSRVCSRKHPAPGNQGFDGCLEFLRLQCMASKRVITVWDAEHFLFLDADGTIESTKKNQLLGLPVASLQWLMTTVRAWTILSKGQLRIQEILEAIQLCTRVGTMDKTLHHPLVKEPKILKRILMFAIGGSARVWTQVNTQLHLPLATEITKTNS